MPHIQKYYDKGKSKGLAIIAINRGDDAKTISEYWTESKFTFPAVLAPDEVHKKFGVRAYPTNYVVDSKGTVVARFVGFDEGTFLNHLASLGVKIE